jgi:hypothetical protein
MAPKPKTIMNSRRMSTPSAETIGALVAPARMSMPTRVWRREVEAEPPRARPEPMMARRQTG